MWVFAFLLLFFGLLASGMPIFLVLGMCAGILYLATGCNLLVPIIAHGVGDTVDVLLLFLGKYPL